MRRRGQVIRIYPHGTIMVWDGSASRCFPSYESASVAVGDLITFEITNDGCAVALQKFDLGGRS